MEGCGKNWGSGEKAERPRTLVANWWRALASGRAAHSWRESAWSAANVPAADAADIRSATIIATRATGA